MTPTARLARLLPDGRPDGALLAAFLADRDESAFAELVRRHGPLVLAACRRLLPDPADAADAFQAAFLVLVRRARRLTGSADLGPWLYRVAAWTARNVRRKNARRLARTAPLADAVPAPPTSPVPALDLDAALLALPEKYRAALVLCHLQGWSRRDAAARLGCPEGTLSSLLARGLTKLKARLPGYEPAVALAVVPAALSAATVAAAAKPMPSAAAELAAAVLRALWVPKATAATAGVAFVFALGVGVGISVREAPAVAQVSTPTAPSPAPRPQAEQVKRDKDAVQVKRAKDADEFAALIKELEQTAGQHAVVHVELLEFLAREADEQFWQREISREKRDAAHASLARARVEYAAHIRRAAGAPPRAETARERERYVPFDMATAYLEMQLRIRRRGGDVTGTLAVDVDFPEAARTEVAAAALELVERATDRTNNASEAAWDAALRGPHVLVRFPLARRPLRVANAPDEVLVVLPLTGAPGGFVLARDHEQVVRYSKYPHAAADRFQAALATAVPAGRAP